MDRFITIERPKKIDTFLCNPLLLETVRKIITTNGIICIYGDSGVGKTAMVNHLLQGLSHFDLIPETFRDLDRLENSIAHIVVDDIELDREFLEKIKNGYRFSKGALIIITQNISKLDFCNCLHFEHPDIGLMVKIGLKNRPKETITRLTSLARVARGNLRTFLYSIDFLESHDLFKSPKDFVSDLLCPSLENPRNYIGTIISEHGYIWGVIHDNYIDVPDIDMVRVSECMSMAELLDSQIYNGNWGLLHAFCTVSTIIPAIEVNHGLVKEKLRPGSAWTKFGNHKMRYNKLVDIRNRTPCHIDSDSLAVVMFKCKKNPENAVDIFKSYGLKASDVDFINHLALKDKLSSKEIQILKKRLACLGTF